VRPFRVALPHGTVRGIQAAARGPQALGDAVANKKNRRFGAGTIAGLALFCSFAASADEIRLTIASSHTTGLPWVGVMASLVVPESNRRLEAMGSEHRIRWTEAYGGSLYKFNHTLELQNVTYMTPFVTNDHDLIFEVMNDLHDQVPALTDAWTLQNQHFLGGSPLDTYHLMTNFPVDSVDDLNGRKILAPGPSAAWLEGTGAVPVDGALTTYYTQIQTGVADGVLTILTGAPPYAIHEVAPYITLVGIGAQLTGGMSVNLDVWNALPADVQDVLSELGREYSRGVADELTVRYQRGLVSMQEQGAIVTELSDEERLKWLNGLPDIAGRWVEATEARGIPAAEVLRVYMDAIRRRGGTPLRDWDRPGN